MREKVFLARGHGQRSQGLSGAPSVGRSRKRRKRESKGTKEGRSGEAGEQRGCGVPGETMPPPAEPTG